MLSSGFDGLSQELLKSISSVITLPLQKIINASIRSGCFPSEWKEAQISPILKKGSATDKSNYRPVSLLSVASKVCEMVVHDQLSAYFEKNKLLPHNQHGFRKNRSTTTALTSVCSHIFSEQQKGHHVALASYDLTAAFDCLDAEILDEKLELYGLSLISRSWIRSFLSNRKQFVKVGNGRSLTIDIDFGSPQGSILSPLLYLIFVADLELWLSEGVSSLYADDIALATSDKTPEDSVRRLETASAEILDFLASNLLVANPAKTAFFVIRNVNNKVKYTLKMDGERIEESDTITLLGAVLSKDMSWSKHVKGLLSSLRSSTGLISRLANYIPNRCLTPLIHGLMLSKVRYALPLFADIRLNDADASSSLMKDIQIEINKGLRIVVGVRLSDRMSIAELLSQVRVPSVNQLAAEVTLTEIWKLLKQDTPISTHFTWLDDYSTKITRNTGKNLLSAPTPGGSNAGKFVRNAATLWNTATQEIRNTQERNEMKRLIRQFSRELPI